MWFGHGTGPGKNDKAGDDGDDLFGPTEVGERIASVARGAIAALPADLRARAEARNDPATRERLREVMTAWAYGAALDHAAFAERFLGRGADDPIAGDLRAAAVGAAMAKSHADLAAAAGHLATAMQAIGLDGRQRFLADAGKRVKDPATIAAVAKSRRPSEPERQERLHPPRLSGRDPGRHRGSRSRRRRGRSPCRGWRDPAAGIAESWSTERQRCRGFCGRGRECREAYEDA
jgi:hypothetical protein